VVDRYAGIGHPGEPGVAQAVSSKVFVAELGHNLVPVRGVPKDGRRDPAGSRAGEESLIRDVADRVDTVLHHLAYLLDQRHSPCPLALGAFVHEPTGGGCGLAPYGP
jgi:hypothetical protein